MWNASLQRELPWKMIGEVAYVGTRQRHVWTNLSRNAVPADALALGPALNTVVPNPSYGIIDPGDLGRSRAVADDDRTHVVTANFIWELPLGPGHRWASRGWAAHVVGGWRL